MTYERVYARRVLRHYSAKKVRLERLRNQEYDRPGNTSDNKLDDLEKDRKALSSVDRIERIELKLQLAGELQMIGPPLLLPAVHSLPACMAYSAWVRSSVPCRERRLVLRRSR